jgi:hypothetical protein
MAGVGRFVLEFRKAGLQANQIWGDAGGMGGPMCDALSQAGWAINRFNFGAKAGNDFAYVNRGSEVWLSFGKQVVNREIVLIRDETLIAQLTSRRTIMDSRGKLRLESKEDMRSRGLKSPDRADAVCAVFGLGGGFANSTNRPNHRFAPSDDPMRALNEYYDGQIDNPDSVEQSAWSRCGLSDPGD